jgi:hypothetical protein
MRFGWLTPGLSESADADFAPIHAVVTQACLAEAVSFDGIWLTEHSLPAS